MPWWRSLQPSRGRCSSSRPSSSARSGTGVDPTWRLASGATSAASAPGWPSRIARLRASAAPATDPAALERLTRSAFRHHARTYLELLLAPSLTGAELERRVTIVDEPFVRETIRPGNRIILVGLHLASVELVGFIAASWTRGSTTAPMETLGDAELQAWMVRTRAAVGLRIVGLREARREMLAALERGEPVGIIADRDISGGGMPVELFGAPASLPIGPALLAVETGTPIYVGSHPALEPLALHRGARARRCSEHGRPA